MRCSNWSPTNWYLSYSWSRWKEAPYFFALPGEAGWVLFWWWAYRWPHNLRQDIWWCPCVRYRWHRVEGWSLRYFACSSMRWLPGVNRCGIASFYCLTFWGGTFWLCWHRAWWYPGGPRRRAGAALCCIACLPMWSNPNPGARPGIHLLRRFCGLRIRVRLSRFTFCDAMTFLVCCLTW